MNVDTKTVEKVHCLQYTYHLAIMIPTVVWTFQYTLTLLFKHVITISYSHLITNLSLFTIMVSVIKETNTSKYKILLKISHYYLVSISRGTVFPRLMNLIFVNLEVQRFLKKLTIWLLKQHLILFNQIWFAIFNKTEKSWQQCYQSIKFVWTKLILKTFCSRNFVNTALALLNDVIFTWFSKYGVIGVTVSYNFSDLLSPSPCWWNVTNWLCKVTRSRYDDVNGTCYCNLRWGNS